jgi:hypothetical protein
LEQQRNEVLTIRFPENLNDLEKLVFLKGYIFLRIQLCLFALEDGTKAGQLGHNTAYCPTVDCLMVMLRSHEKLRRAVPDSDHYFIPCKKGLQRLIRETSKTEVSDFDYSGRRDENIRRFEVPMQYMRVMKV